MYRGTREMYKERHLKLKPDVCMGVCVCANTVLDSRLAEMPKLGQWFSFIYVFVVFKKSILGRIKNKLSKTRVSEAVMWFVNRIRDEIPKRISTGTTKALMNQEKQGRMKRRELKPDILDLHQGNKRWAQSLPEMTCLRQSIYVIDHPKKNSLRAT